MHLLTQRTDTMSKQTISFIVLLHLASCVFAQKVIGDVPYCKNAGTEQKMDIYLPGGDGFRTILFFHEGSLVTGDKRDSPLEDVARKFQREGICFVTANYRLGPQNKWPAQPKDAYAAFAWLKNNLIAYGADTSKIYVMGHSSGAFLAAVISTDSKYWHTTRYSPRNIAGFISIGTQLDPMLPAVSEDRLQEWFERDSYLKIFGSRAVFDDANPKTHINSEVPKGLIIVAESEQFNPPLLQQAKEFVEEGKRIGLNLNYLVVKNRTHMSTITRMPGENDETFNIIARFIKE